GALAFFCKSYALYFFLAHFTLVTAINLMTSTTSRERWQLLKAFALVIGITALLVAGWVGALHRKYGIITLGVIGSYKYAMRAPDLSGAPPLEYIGFVDPPATTTVSVWEEPYYIYKMLDRWSPFDSRRAFFHQLRLTKASVVATLEAFRRF